MYMCSCSLLLKKKGEMKEAGGGGGGGDVRDTQANCLAKAS